MSYITFYCTLKCFFFVSIMASCDAKNKYSRRIHVSSSGNDTVLCGNSSTPCLTIAFAVHNISQDGDTILVNHSREHEYKECENCALWGSAIIIDKSLSIVGQNGTAVIRCRGSCNLFKVRGNDAHQQSRVEFVNLLLVKAQRAVNYVNSSSQLVLRNCSLQNNSFGIALEISMKPSLLVINCSFQDNGWGIFSKKCKNMKSTITSSHFISSMVLLENIQAHPIVWQEFKALISNCIFTGDGKKMKSWESCPILLTIKTVSMCTNITIRKSVFSNSSHVCKAFLLQEATNNQRITTLITLDELLVENNHNEQSVFKLQSFYKRWRAKFKVKIINSIFQNNTARALLAEVKSLYKFPRNVYILQKNNTFLKNGFFVHQSKVMYSPVVYLGRGRHHLQECTFVDNYPHGTANSAVLVVSNKALIILTNNLFLITHPRKSIQIYAESDSTIRFTGTNNFSKEATFSDQVIVQHQPRSGQVHGQVLIRGKVNMMCPSGYRFIFLNQESRSSQSLSWEYFSASCAQCPRKTYSIQRGKLKNNITYDINCYNCPRGGVCESGQLYAKRGFWGLEEENHRIKLNSCPFGYCCEQETCKSYNVCHGKRTGRLCSRCPEGMSEALFSTECWMNDDCKAHTFWIVFSIILICYILFFLYHEEIIQFLMKSLPSRQLNNNPDLQEQSNENSSRRPSSGYLKIFFFYYQMVNIILEAVNFRDKVGVFSGVTHFVSQGINMMIVNISAQNCPFKNLRPVGKSVFLHSLGLWLLFLITLTYLLCYLANWIKQWQRNMIILTSEITNDTSSENSNKSFHARIGCAFTYVCLLMYSSSAKLCFSLLNCVSVGNDSVLFIDGTVNCYQPFQHILITYTVFSILPFCFVPVLGSYLLFLKQISPIQIYLGCLFPLPYCCYWSYILIKYCKKPVQMETTNDILEQSNGSDDAGRQALLRILSGPFRTHKSFLGLPKSKVPWEGALIFCRLILLLSLTLNGDNRVRGIIMTVICLAVLVLHLHFRPFVSAHENFCATLSLCSIIIICTLTLIKAVYHGEDTSSLSQNQSLLRACDITTTALHIIPIALLTSLLVFVLFYKLLFKLFLLLKQMRATFHHSRTLSRRTLVRPSPHE